MIPNKTVVASSDLRGLSRLGFAAAVGLTDVVEQMHRTISRAPLPFGAPVQEPTNGVTGLVYRSIRVRCGSPAVESMPLSRFSDPGRTPHPPRGAATPRLPR